MAGGDQHRFQPHLWREAPKVEVYLIGYQGSLYDRILEVDFLARLRNIQRFGSVAELIAQMNGDVAATRRIAEVAP